MRFYQKTSLPSSLQPDSWYLILNGDKCEAYVTDNSGVAKKVGNTAFIDERVNTAASQAAQPEYVADIPARDLLVLSANKLVFVQDATADPTVGSGSALYFYESGGGTYIKAAEFESMDLNIVADWADLTGKPNSSVSAIDDAVAKRHTHTNKTLLDSIGGTSTDPTIDGNPVALLVENDW